MKYIDFRNKGFCKCPEIDRDVEMLDLSFNNLSDLPDYFSELTKLRILFLSDNCFTSIPRVISRMPFLFMLSFRNNEIVYVDGISENLSWLILTNNHIESISDSIGKCTNLQKLMLSGNNLKTLPKTLIDCKQLELIRMSNNNFDHVPKILFKLKNLSWISIAGNSCFPSPKKSHFTTKKSHFISINSEEIVQLDTIGEGTSGIVKRCLFSGNTYAAKFYKPCEITSDGSSDNELFILSSLAPHDNIVHVEALFSNGKGMLMKLYKGYKTLGNPPNFDTISRDTYTKELIFQKQESDMIIKQIEEAVAHLHKNGIIHGDLYAHNIIFDPISKHTVLTDFGASFLVDKVELLEKFIAVENRALEILKQEIHNLIKS